MSVKRKASKPRQVVRDKAELLAELKQDTAWQARMSFTKEQFWPALCEASTSIEDASVLIEGFYSQIMTEYLSRMKDLTLGDLKLAEKLDQTSERYVENAAMVALFDDMPLPQAKQIIEGMKGEIAQFQADEMRSRPLSSLKTTWLDD